MPSEPLTPELLDRMREEATPEPWAWPHDNALAGDYRGPDSEWALVAAIHDAGLVSPADAALIALAPTLAARLAEAMRALEEIERYNGRVPRPLMMKKIARTALASIREVEA